MSFYATTSVTQGDYDPAIFVWVIEGYFYLMKNNAKSDNLPSNEIVSLPVKMDFETHPSVINFT